MQDTNVVKKVVSRLFLTGRLRASSKRSASTTIFDTIIYVPILSATKDNVETWGLDSVSVYFLFKNI